MAVHSLLDNDLYKLTMMQFVFHNFPKKIAQYRLIFRNRCHEFWTHQLKTSFLHQVDQISKFSFKSEELSFLNSLNCFSEDFLDFLHEFQLNRNHIKFDERNELFIEGPWTDVILWEVILLATLCELYFAEAKDFTQAQATGRSLLLKKIEKLKKEKASFKFIEFGTRRRFSSDWQYELCETLKTQLPELFLGTSNMYVAQKLNLKCFGTMGHEILQAGQQLAPTFSDFQSYILKNWYSEFGNSLSIALTDVLSTDAFLNDFEPELARKYKGLRIDSGDPIEIGEKILSYYQKNGIDTQSKILVFSNSLDFDKAQEINHHFKNKCRILFGLGTFLTNDHGIPPLNVVIKLTQVDGKPVGKITDYSSKSHCVDPGFLEKLKQLKRTKEHEYLVTIDRD